MGDDEGRTVNNWRFRNLFDAGYPPHLASVLADDVQVDLHLAVELVGHGCEPLVAVEILK